MAIAIEQLVVPNPMIVSRPMSDGAVLMNTTSGDCYELNAIGASVWDGVHRGETLREIIEKIAAAYHVDLGIVRGDVTKLIDELAHHGIVSLPSR